jgi:hypothetical protein
MENNNTLDALREQRRQMFEKMGVKNAGQMVTETAVNTGAKNLNVLQKIQQIKSGAAKSELNKYVSASSKSSGSSTPGLAGFDPLPEVKVNRQNPNAPTQQVNSEYKVPLDNFSSPNKGVDNSELSMIDAMFSGEGSRMSMNPYGANSFDSGQPLIPQRSQNTQLDLGSTLNSMPSFNPEHAVQRAKAKSQGNSFLQFAQESPAGNPSDYAVDYAPQDSHIAQQNQNMGITPAMKMMMESIAKTMAEQTIKRVLTEFTETQKNKVFYEVYNKEKSIIKTSDGKLYKLTPVQVKR